MTQKDAGAIRVVSADGVWLDDAHKPRRLVVDSIYHRAINLQDEQGELFTLAARALDDAPRTARLDVHDFTTWPIHPGQYLNMTRGQTLGEQLPMLDWSAARKRPRQIPVVAQASPEVLERAASVLRRALEQRPLGGAAKPRAEDSSIAAHFARSIYQAADALRLAVTSRDPARLHEAFEAAIGLGPGSTPSLDDFLTGILLVASHSDSSMHFMVDQLRGYLRRHPAKTTNVSKAMLTAALNADFSTTLVGVANALVSGGTENETDFWINAALGIGHSSGSDILTGLLAGLEMEQELREYLCLSQQW